MSFQANVGRTLNATPAGRLVFRAIRPIVHLTRRIAYPDLPPNLQRSKVRCRDKQISIVHRRTHPDACVIEQCFPEAQYDMPGGVYGDFIDRIYRQILARDRQPLIVDCGANIGASVLWFAHRYPQAHILAIEPAPDNFAVLQRNAANRDVDLRQVGIAASDGRAHLTDPDESSLSYRTCENGEGPEIVTMAFQTLLASKPSDRYQPFLLKIDIEGAEKTLFAGDSSSLNSFPLIVMEPHDWMLPGQRTSVEFFRFHAAAEREFCMKHENIASIAFDPNLLDPLTEPAGDPARISLSATP
ncbi:MAG: FkbM family methyltransferase [Edaphobacter sp.]|nr:FkbM family methyltransferase [Edaphobacter sp.]